MATVWTTMRSPTSGGSTPPKVSKNRLSKHEERVISASFHRARGYEPTMSFAQFRDSVMHEAFVAMPLELVQRVFQVWSSSGAQALTLKEFLAGVTTIVKGSREEHLQFVFQLIAQSRSTNSRTSSRHKSFSSGSSITRDDTFIFLQVMSIQLKPNDVLAIERTGDADIKRWTRSSLLLLLHPNTSDTLTCAKFVKILSSKQFQDCTLVDWIPRFAAQFVLNAAKMERHTTLESPSSMQFLPSPASASAEMIGSLPVRIASSSMIEQRQVEPVEPVVSQGDDITVKTVENSSFIGVSPSPSIPQWDAIKHEFISLLEYVVATNEPLPFAAIKKQYERLVPERVLRTLQVISIEASDAVERGCSDARNELRVFMLGLCSAFSPNAAQVFRFLFALFDPERHGYLTTERLAAFLRFAIDVSQDDSERWAYAVLSSDTATMSFDQFLLYVDGSLSSSTRFFTKIEVEQTHLLFHLHHALSDPKWSLLGPNEQCASVLKTTITQFSFSGGQKKGRNQTPQANQCCCVLEHQIWLRIVDFLCTSSEESSDDLRTFLSESIPILPVSSLKNGGRSCRESGPKAQLALVPISVWTTIAFLQRRRHSQIKYEREQQWLSKVDFSVENGDLGQEPFQFSGFCLALALKWTALDDRERDIVLPRVILNETRSIHELVVVVRMQNDWLSTQRHGSEIEADIDSFSDCQLRFSVNGVKDLQTKRISPDQMRMPFKRLLQELSNPDSTVQSLALDITALDFRMESASEPKTAEEDSEEPSLSKSRSSSVSNSASWNNIHGLANLGNTCFMNSALQCLVATPLLREYFLQHEYLHDLAPRINSAVNGSMPRSQSASNVNASLLPLAFGQLMRKMNAYTSAGAISGVCDVISPTELKQTLAALFPDLSDGSQQDAQEFLSSLLSALSDELKRTPQCASVATESESSASATKGSPRSFLARMVCTSSDDVVEDAREERPQQNRTLQPSDSNGRPDHLVAQEWWLSHLLNEPSVITALFSGQYKSVLTCSACGFESVRFEPFSSLQLPLKLNDHTESDLQQTAARSDFDVEHSDAIVLLHFAESPGQRASLRLAMRIRSDWALDQLFLKLERDFATFSHGQRRQYIAASVAGPSIQDLLDCDSLLIALPSPIHVYELEHVSSGTKIPLDRVLMDETHGNSHVGNEVLVWSSSDRYIKGQVITRHVNPMDFNAMCVDISLQEGIYEGNTVRNISRVIRKTPRTLETRVLYLRFMHRQTVLVPFYCTSPYRQVAFGFPFVHRARAGAITGRSLYSVVKNRFVSKDKKRVDQSFVLHHVRWDGKACKQCHWSLQCRGCVISPTGTEALLDLEMDDVIAIEWQTKPVDEKADCVDPTLQVEDDKSYVAYCQTNAQPLERSLELLCSTERLDALCSTCQQCKAESSPSSRIFTPHTKTLMLWSVPPILVIQLKRFELDAHGDGYHWKKLTQGIDLPLDRLSLRRFLSPAAKARVSDAVPSDAVIQTNAFLMHKLQMPLDSASRTCSAYSLFGIVNHVGDLGSGHYTSHIRHPESGGWWLVDDATAEQVHDPHQQLTPSSAAYLLFYVRHDIALEPAGPASQSDRRLKRLTDFFPRRGRSANLHEQTLQAQIQNRQTVRSPSAGSQDACGFM